MPTGSGQRPLVALVVGLALAVSCGRTSDRGRRDLGPSDDEAGASATRGGAEAVAGSRSGAAAGDGGASDAAGAPHAGTSEPGSLVFDGVVTRVDVVGDRDGNALVKWDEAPGLVGCARWDATRREWLYPAPVTMGEASLIDGQRSGHPILLGEETDPDSGATKTIVRRFDVKSNEWGPARAIGVRPAFAWGFYLSMDGAGNVYAYWLNEDRASQSFTWWPVDQEEWAPLQPIEHASRIVGTPGQGAWLWQENSGFGVRKFDVELGSWGDEYELAPRDSASAWSIHQLVVGPSGEALAAAYLQEPPERVLDVWRYDPGLDAWQPRETALTAPMPSDQNGGPGPAIPLTDFAHHDIVAVPLPEGDEYTMVLKRRDATTGEWSPLREIAGLATPHSIELVGDDQGNFYASLPTGLLRYNGTTNDWLETPVEGGSFKLVVSGTSVFALGWNTTPTPPSSPGLRTELVAYHHAASDSEWRPVRGLPEGAVPEIGSVPFGIAALDDDRAIVVWPTREDGRHGSVRAAFIE